MWHLFQVCRPGILSKSITITHHIKQAKQGKYHKENHDTSIVQKSIWQNTTHPFMTKTVSKLGIEGNILDLIKNIYKNIQLTTSLTVRHRTLSPKIVNKARIPPSPLLLNSTLEVLTKAMRQDKVLPQAPTTLCRNLWSTTGWSMWLVCAVKPWNSICRSML